MLGILETPVKESYREEVSLLKSLRKI